MKNIVPFLAALVLLPFAAQAADQNSKTCEELQKEIATKLDVKGVQNYTLTMVKPGEVKAGDKIVGTCAGGTLKIIYTRN